MKKTNLEKYIEDICVEFQMKKGKASCYAMSSIPFEQIVYNVYALFVKKNPRVSVFIVVDGYNTRKKIIDYLNSKDCTVENGYSYKVLSADYIKDKYQYNYKLIITVGVNDDIEILRTLNSHATFMLSIFTKDNLDHDFKYNVRQFLPKIVSSVNERNINDDRVYSPVEIHQCAAYMLAEDVEQYVKATEYINNSISIFGSFDAIEKARVGDINNNISSAAVRDMIARNNGWSIELDMTSDFNKRVDEVYNPNSLLERANCVYTIMRERRNLVANNNCKLDVVKRIVKANPDKKILIVSKKGEFASTIADHLNTEGSVCIDYHNELQSRPIMNDEGTDYIRYKSGENKGKIKMFGEKAISTYHLGLFNLNAYSCLSIKSSSNPKLKTAIDLVIFTSPLCDDIIDFKKRFADVTFNTMPNIVYLIYCDGTIESDKLYDKKNNNLFTIVDETEKDVVYNENTNDIIW